MEQPLSSLASSVPTSSTKKRIRIFKSDIPSILHLNSEMSAEFSSQLVDLIFMTLYIYDDRGSRKAVDDLIIKALNEVIFMKTFAANLVQAMEKQLKLQSHVGCYRLMNWSCLLLCKSQFISVSKNAFSKVAAAQALCLQVSLQGSSHERRACRRTFIHSFLESPDIFSLYMEELKSARISYKNCSEMLCVLLDYSSSKMSLFEQWKDNGNSNSSGRRETAVKERAAAGKKDTGKPTKKPDKQKTSKEEARDLQLREEAVVREKVTSIQKNLSLLLKALGEMAIANPVFTHSELPSLVKFVTPLLHSPIVDEVAYETMVKLSKCTAPPLSNWGLDIATALSLIATTEAHVSWDQLSSLADGDHGRSSSSLFERVMHGLSVSCKSYPIPVDSFSFVFPIMERILSSPKKT